MNKLVLKIVFIVILSIIISINCVYGADQTAELVNMLDELKTELGDLKEFGKVFDKMNDDLGTIPNVDDELKTKLKADVQELDKVTDMNPEVLETLKNEFNSQIDSLDNSNVQEFQDEISAIANWANHQVDMDNGNNSGYITDEETNKNSNSNNNTITITNNNNSINNTTKNNIKNNVNNNSTNYIRNNTTNKNTTNEKVDNADDLPNTGTSSNIIIAIGIIAAIAIFAKIRDDELKGI